MHRFIVPAAILASLLVTVAVRAGELKPYQQSALERILATMDAETRAFARPQLEEMLATMNEEQVRMVVASMLEQAPDNPPDEPAEDPVEGSEEDTGDLE